MMCNFSGESKRIDSCFQSKRSQLLKQDHSREPLVSPASSNAQRSDSYVLGMPDPFHQVFWDSEGFFGDLGEAIAANANAYDAMFSNAVTSEIETYQYGWDLWAVGGGSEVGKSGTMEAVIEHMVLFYFFFGGCYKFDFTLRVLLSLLIPGLFLSCMIVPGSGEIMTICTLCRQSLSALYLIILHPIMVCWGKSFEVHSLKVHFQKGSQDFDNEYIVAQHATLSRQSPWLRTLPEKGDRGFMRPPPQLTAHVRHKFQIFGNMSLISIPPLSKVRSSSSIFGHCNLQCLTFPSYPTSPGLRRACAKFHWEHGTCKLTITRVNPSWTHLIYSFLGNRRQPRTEKWSGKFLSDHGSSGDFPIQLAHIAYLVHFSFFRGCNCKLAFWIPCSLTFRLQLPHSGRSPTSGVTRALTKLGFVKRFSCVKT